MFLVLLLCSAGYAHKVNIFAYAESGIVHTESYFPDGRPVEGGKVSVYDGSDKLLLEGTTDKEGLFNFPIPVVSDIELVLDATMGHKNSFKLEKGEVEQGQGKLAHEPETKPSEPGIKKVLSGIGAIFAVFGAWGFVASRRKG